MTRKTLRAAWLAVALFPVAVGSYAGVVDPTKISGADFRLPENIAKSMATLGKRISSTIRGHVSGSGTVSGSGYVHCVGSSLTGSVPLSGNIHVSGNGAQGNIHVSGTASISGFCSHGSGNGSGSAWLNGSGTVRDREGRSATAHVSGHAMVSTHSGSSFVTVFVTVSGSY